MKCIKCGIREATRGNYCDIDRPSAGDQTKVFDSALSLTELRDALALTEATESSWLISLNAASLEESGQSIPVTRAVFEHYDLLSTPRLHLVEVKNEQDVAATKTVEQSKGYHFVTRSSVYVHGKLTDILVFRRE